VNDMGKYAGGTKYRVVDSRGKVIIRTKVAWDRYRKKEGYSLEVWLGVGRGWKFLMESTPPKKIGLRGKP